MHKKLALTCLAACLLLGINTVWAHDGAHDKDDHGKGNHSRFEEGSGSSAVDAHKAGSEYSGHGEYREGHGDGHDKGMYGHSKDHGKNYEEGSDGMQGKSHDGEKAHKRMEGSH